MSNITGLFRYHDCCFMNLPFFHFHRSISEQCYQTYLRDDKKKKERLKKLTQSGQAAKISKLWNQASNSGFNSSSSFFKRNYLPW